MRDATFGTGFCLSKKQLIMKKTLIFTALTISLMSGFAQSGKVMEEKNVQKRDLKGFHAIRISGGIDLYLSQSGSEAVAVSSNRNEDIAKIKTEVVDGVLNIYMDKDGWSWGSHGTQVLKAFVSCKVIDALKASGGSDIFFEDVVKGDKLALEITGGSDFRGKMEVRELAINQTGGSDSYVSGSASTLSVHATGGSDLHGYELTTSDCHVEATGGSDVKITVNKELSVSATGGSDVTYRGSAVIKDQHTSGSSSVSRKG